MPIWDKVKQELDRAGQVAQDAIDEGRVRLEAQRAQRLADRAAQVLGYAIYRARKAGTPLDDAEIGRHADRVAQHEAETERLKAQLSAIQQRWRGPGGRPAGDRPSGGGTEGGAATGRPDPIDPTPAPPASATTPPPPEAEGAPPATGATTTPTIDVDPWRPVDPPTDPTSFQGR